MGLTAYDSLSPRHRSFVDAYTGRASFNATEAYRVTYGCKDSTANTNGPALLVKAGIAAAIAERLDAAAMDAAEVLHRLTAIGRDDAVPQVQLRALTTLAKVYGLFAPKKVDATIDVDADVLAQLTKKVATL